MRRRTFFAAAAFAILCAAPGGEQLNQSFLSVSLGGATEYLSAVEGGAYARGVVSAPLVVRRRGPLAVSWSVAGGLAANIPTVSLGRTTFGASPVVGAVSLTRALTSNTDFAAWANDGSTRTLTLTALDPALKPARAWTLRECAPAKFEPIHAEKGSNAVTETLTLQCRAIALAAPVPAGPLTDLFNQASNPRAELMREPRTGSLVVTLADASAKPVRTVTYQSPTLAAYSFDAASEVFEIASTRAN